MAAMNGMVDALGGLGRAGFGASTAAGASVMEEQPFGGVLQGMVAQASSLDTQAKDAVTGLLSGKGVDVHEAMIATQKADMAFELALAVRNKAVGAYQQMMQMQF